MSPACIGGTKEKKEGTFCANNFRQCRPLFFSADVTTSGRHSEAAVCTAAFCACMRRQAFNWRGALGRVTSALCLHNHVSLYSRQAVFPILSGQFTPFCARSAFSITPACLPVGRYHYKAKERNFTNRNHV